MIPYCLAHPFTMDELALRPGTKSTPYRRSV